MMSRFFLRKKPPSCPEESWDVSSFKHNLSLFSVPLVTTLTQGQIQTVSQQLYKGAFIFYHKTVHRANSICADSSAEF